MSRFSVFVGKSSLIRNLNLSSRIPVIRTEILRNFSDNNKSNNDNENDGTFISDNWSCPLSDDGKIQSVEQLSDFGKNLLCGSLFTVMIPSIILKHYTQNGQSI